MSHSALAQLYASIVEESLGLVATIDADDDVVFKYPELGTLLISVQAEHDPEVFQMVLPNFLGPADLGLDRERFLDAINRVNAQAKGAKVYYSDTTGRATAVVAAVLAAADTAPRREVVEAGIVRQVGMLRNAALLLVGACGAIPRPQRDEKALLN